MKSPGVYYLSIMNSSKKSYPHSVRSVLYYTVNRKKDGNLLPIVRG